jgi:transcriptional regulator with XRE-family HTH domain
MTRGGRPPKLEPQDVTYARQAKARGERMSDICRYLGVSETTLKRYLRGECRQHQEAA